MAAAGVLTGILIGNNLTRLKAGLAAAAVAWKELEPRGLALGTEKVTGIPALAAAERPVLAGAIDGVDVMVQVLSDTVHYAHTRVVARPASGGAALVGVHPSPGGILGRIRSWLGQDIVVGDPAFDDAFLVTGEPASAAPSLLDAPIRERIVAIAPCFAGFVRSKGEVIVLLHGVVTDTAAVGTAIDLACAAARWAG